MNLACNLNLFHLYRRGRTTNRLANESIELRLPEIASVFAFPSVVSEGNRFLVCRTGSLFGYWGRSAGAIVRNRKEAAHDKPLSGWIVIAS
jgi:hypothetical protein